MHVLLNAEMLEESVTRICFEFIGMSSVYLGVYKFIITSVSILHLCEFAHVYLLCGILVAILDSKAPLVVDLIK